MPRMRRLVVPDYPHHILHRGHNGESVFKDEEDRLKYLEDLREIKIKMGIEVYGWCLLPDQVHLLLNPGSDPNALSEMMKALAARTTRHRNRKEGRSGTLWESRYRSSVIQRGAWTLSCIRYLEMLPVLRERVDEPEHFPWSSFAMRMGRIEPNWLDDPKEFQELGDGDLLRRKRYRTFLNQPIEDAEAQTIQSAVMRNQLTGDKRLTDEVESMTGVRVSARGRGRPRVTPRDRR